MKAATVVMPGLPVISVALAPANAGTAESKSCFTCHGLEKKILSPACRDAAESAGFGRGGESAGAMGTAACVTGRRCGCTAAVSVPRLVTKQNPPERPGNLLPLCAVEAMMRGDGAYMLYGFFSAAAGLITVINI